MIDLHCHLLPGVDDGSRTVEQSVRVLQAMKEAGVTAVCLTPHHTVGRMPLGLPPSHDLAFAALSAVVPDGIVLHRGVELMLDRPIPGDIRERPGLTLAGTRHILVEFTGGAAVSAVANALYQIVQAGLIPVLAHPERYRACTPQAVSHWKGIGALMQVDATTLLSGRGRGQRAREILAHGLADIIAADNHGDARTIGDGYRFLCEAGGAFQADLLAVKNPSAILADAGVEPVPPLAIKTRIMDKLKQLLGPVGMSPRDLIRAGLLSLARAAESTAALAPEAEAVAERYIAALSAGGTLYFAGNGGSAADAQHLATEYVVRFRKARRPFRAVALTTETSLLTAAGNDLGFDQIFARQVEAFCRAGDVLILHSTTGASPNLLTAARAAKSRGLTVVGFLGRDGGALKDLVDVAIVVPSDNTSRIQELHLALEHLIVEAVEARLAQ